MGSFPRLDQYPKNAITIANGDTHVINRKGSFLRVREATTKFTLIFDDVHQLRFEQNDALNLGRDQQGNFRTFSNVRVVNDTGADLTFQLEIGDGEITTNNTSSSGETAVKTNTATELQIQTKAGTTLKVDDDETQTKLDTIETSLTALENLLQNDQDLRMPLNTLEGGTYASAVNTTNTVVTGGANTSGVIIRLANFKSTQSSQNAELIINGNVVAFGYITGKEWIVPFPLFVPAGQSVAIKSSGSSTTAFIIYETL